MALTPERRHTMRFYAEGARSRGERVTTAPKVLLELLDMAEASKFPFPAIRSVGALRSLPVDSVLVAAGPTGALEVYHKQKMSNGLIDWYTPGVARTIEAREIPLPATLLFIPKAQKKNAPTQP